MYPGPDRSVCSCYHLGNRGYGSSLPLGKQGECIGESLVAVSGKAFETRTCLHWLVIILTSRAICLLLFGRQSHFECAHERFSARKSGPFIFRVSCLFLPQLLRLGLEIASRHRRWLCCHQVHQVLTHYSRCVAWPT